MRNVSADKHVERVHSVVIEQEIAPGLKKKKKKSCLWICRHLPKLRGKGAGDRDRDSEDTPP